MADQGAPTTSTFADFDAFFAERETKPVLVPFDGQEWPCPGTVPAEVLLRIDRLMLQVTRMQQSGEVPEDFEVTDDLSVESIARSLAGDDNVDAWLARGMSFQRLQMTTQVLQRVHRGASLEDAMREALGEATAPPPNRAERRATASRSRKSSGGGQRSKRTGSGSTGKT